MARDPLLSSREYPYQFTYEGPEWWTAKREQFVPLNVPLYRIAQATAVVTQVRIESQESLTRKKQLDELLRSVIHLQAMVSVLIERAEEDVLTKIVPLNSLGSKSYVLRRPIFAVVETYKDEVVARLPEFDIYASGEIEADAIRGLRQDLLVLFDDLRSSESELGELPASWLRDLSEYIEERR
jgi:hypothetical protein